MNVSHPPAAAARPSGSDAFINAEGSAGLHDARLYLCTDARRSQGDFEQFVDAAFAGGVDIIQLRDKSIEAAEELELLAVLKEAAVRHGRLWAVNDRADIAVLSGAPVFHIGQKDLPLKAARTLLKPWTGGCRPGSGRGPGGARLLLRGPAVGNTHQARPRRRRPGPGDVCGGGLSGARAGTVRRRCALVRDRRD